MFKVIIAGSRNYYNFDELKRYVDYKLSHIKSSIVIISGGAQGADSLGQRYARQKGYLIERYPAEWDKFGKAAGPTRNRLMAQNADALIAFWDGKSPGTRNMIEEARKEKLKIAIKYI